MTLSVSVPSGDTLTSVSVVTGGAPNGDFTNAGGGTCTSGVTLSTTCTMQVSFAPKFAGPRSGAVVLADANGVVATAYLRGNGVGPQAVFATRATPAALSATLTGLPTSVAIDGSGNVYVGDSGNPTSLLSGTPIGRVLKETPSGGAYTQTVVATGLYAPQSIGVDGAGNLYVHDAGNGNVNSDAIYKEVLSNGKYVQSLVTVVPFALGQSALAITSVAVDSAGNVYFLGLEGAGVAASIYVDTLQSDGSYAQNGPLPTPAPIVPGETCNSTRTDSLAVDGNGTLYFNGYVDCAGAFQSFTYYVTFVYSSGIANAPVSIPSLSAQLPLTAASNLPVTTNMFADSRGDLYFWTLFNIGTNFNASAGYDFGNGFNEFVPSATGYSNQANFVISLGSVTPYGVAVDAGGNIFFSDVGSGFGNQSGSGVYWQHYTDPPSLTFQTTAKGAVSADSPQSVTIQNIGNASFTATSLTFPTNFPAGSSTADPATCTPTITLASEATCTLQIEFIPVSASPTATPQPLSESVTLASNLVSSPSAITVTGAVEGLPTAATPTFSPAAGTYTSTQSVSLSDTTPGANIYYTVDGTVPTISSSKYSNPISISSTETIQALAIASGYNNSGVATATYTIVPPSDFSITVTPSSLTIDGGQTGSSTVSILPQNGFDGTVSFACSGLPAGAACNFSPSTVTPSGTATSTSTVTISVPASLSAVHGQSVPVDYRRFPGGMVYAAGAFCFIFLAKRRTHPRLLEILAVLAITSLVGCGAGTNNGGSSPHQPVTSTVTITATAGTLQRTGTISLTIP